MNIIYFPYLSPWTIRFCLTTINAAKFCKFGLKEKDEFKCCCDVWKCVIIMKYSLCWLRVYMKFGIRIAWICQQQTIDRGCVICWMTHQWCCWIMIMYWTEPCTVRLPLFCSAFLKKSEKRRSALFTLLLLWSVFPAFKNYKKEILWKMFLSQRFCKCTV